MAFRQTNSLLLNAPVFAVSQQFKLVFYISDRRTAWALSFYRVLMELTSDLIANLIAIKRGTHL